MVRISCATNEQKNFMHFNKLDDTCCGLTCGEQLTMSFISVRSSYFPQRIFIFHPLDCTGFDSKREHMWILSCTNLYLLLLFGVINYFRELDFCFMKKKEKLSQAKRQNNCKIKRNHYSEGGLSSGVHVFWTH